jgi:rsbT co-antagonist protein RsbR
MTLAAEIDDGAGNARGLLDLYQIEPEDLERIAAGGLHIVDALEAYVDTFYEWLEKGEFFADFFSDPKMLARVKRLQVPHWREFFTGQVDEAYVRSRRSIGETHARIGLPPDAYLSAMNKLQQIFANVVADSNVSAEELAGFVNSLSKLMHLDTAIVIDEFTQVTSEIISQQGKALMEMSTPVTAIWQGILMLPIVGFIDSKRSMDIMNAMLAKISDTHAEVIIIDISGVDVVDTAVANHLIKITKASRLMGCESTISGVSPAIAQTIVELGIEVGTIHTAVTLRDALENAFRVTGVDIRSRA